MAEHCDKHGLDYWPKRNDPLRATVVPQLSKSNKDEMNNNTLSRCRSLEFLDDRNQPDRKLDEGSKGNLHRSFDLLNHIERHEAIIHHNNMTDADTSKSSSMQHSTNTSESGRNTSKKYSLDFREVYGDTHSTLSDAESLEDFSNKTKEIIQMKRASRQKFKERTMNELRERQKMDNSFLKYPPNFSSTLTSNSIDDLRSYHSSHHYPNDFDDISVEMKNITKLLSASIIEPLESVPSTSSSFYQSTDKLLAKRFTLYDKDHDHDNDDDEDDGSSIKSELELDATNSYSSKSTEKSIRQEKPFAANGFFQNTCFFENRSSSSCDTLKSVEMSKTNGKSNTNGNENAEDEDEEESDTDMEEIVDVEVKLPAHLQTFNHRAPRPGLVSQRIKSLLAKNLQTNNKMPTVRSSLAGGTSNFKSSKQLRVPLKVNDSPKSQTSSNTPQNNVSPITVSTNHMDVNGFKMIDAETLQAIGDLQKNQTQNPIHTTTTTDLSDERTNSNDI